MIASLPVMIAFLQLWVQLQKDLPRSNFGGQPFLGKTTEKSTPGVDAAAKRMIRKPISPNIETKIKVVDVKRLGANKAAKVVKTLYRESRGFALVALPEESLLIFRAEAKACEEIECILKLITPGGSKGR